VTIREAESSLLRPTLLGLLRLRWANQMTLADVEVPWHQKRIDLVFVSPEAAIGCVAIEFKIDNLASALRQAHLNRLVTPSSWIATPRVTELQEKRAQKLGVGVLLVTAKGAYPLLYPMIARSRDGILREILSSRRRRLRDLLGETLHA
jgi:hypothetical protein